jgi:hypothetical protein
MGGELAKGGEGVSAIDDAPKDQQTDGEQSVPDFSTAVSETWGSLKNEPAC